MKVKIISSNKEPKTVELKKEIFEADYNNKILSQAVLMNLANKRAVISATKDRGEVSGGGRKPFKQKGTGRARAGSNRSPLWIGGGITFGPQTNRNFKKRMPKKMRRLAMKIAMSEKAKAHKVIVVAKFGVSKIATSEIQNILEKLPIEEGKILAVISKTNVELELSSANLKYLKVVTLDGLNLIDILTHDYLLFDEESLIGLEKHFSPDSKVKK